MGVGEGASHTSPTRQPDDDAWSVGLAAYPTLPGPGRCSLKCSSSFPLPPPPGRLVSVDLPSIIAHLARPPHPHGAEIGPPPQIRSFSLALALPARHSRREYLSARARRASKQVIIALVARVACPVPLRLARDSTRLIVQRYCVSDCDRCYCLDPYFFMNRGD